MQANRAHKVTDICSGLLFLAPAYIAWQHDMVSTSLLAAAVASTSFLHIMFPFYAIRIIDYACAVSYILVCLGMVVLSDFLYPHTIYAVLCASIAFTLYGLYSQLYRQHKWSIMYAFWHVFAVGVAIFSTLAFIESV